MAAGNWWRGFGIAGPGRPKTAAPTRGLSHAAGPTSGVPTRPDAPGPLGPPGAAALATPKPGPKPNGLAPAGAPRRRGLSGVRMGRLEVALVVSLALHGALLALRIADPERFDRVFRETPLEVILVNARSDQTPDRPQAVAQAALAGGGSLDQGRATSPLPAMPQVQLGDASEEARRRIEQLQQQQTQLLAQVQLEIGLMRRPDPPRETETPQGQAQEDHRRQLLKLLAEIEKRINDDNAQPRKRYVSPATREVAYAVYYDKLRRRIEERGTRDFPENGGKKLYGELTMNITVDAGGRVVDADVVQASSSRLLDRRALAIVRSAAPFGRFSASMRSQVDEIVVSARFRFTRDNGLGTSISAVPP